MKNRPFHGIRSQAALEFLTTYGWAFLVILIMIGALAYFGILKPSRLLPDRCSTGPEFECQDFQISKADDTIKMRLKNNAGGPVAIESMSVTAESAASLSCNNPDTSGTWGVGEIRDFTFTNCNSDAVGFVAGEKGKALFSVRYYAIRSGSSYAHDVTGEIFSTVI